MNKTTTWTGLAPKLLGTIFLSVAIIGAVMTVVSSSRVEEVMRAEFESKGEAIAAALVSAAERSVFEDISSLQGTIDLNRDSAGVAYIYVENPLANEIVVHTFAPSFPKGLEALNPVKVGEALEGGRRVQTREIQFGDYHVFDVAAPAGAGALGVVHVGMNYHLIEEQVGHVQLRMLALGGGLGLVSLLVGLLIVYFTVIRPVRKLTQVSAAIALTGDLTQKIEIHSRDEIGELAGSFSQMVERLRGIALNLHETVRTLTTAVSELSVSSTEQNEIVTRQAAALQETQVTAQEIKQTSLLAAQKAEAVLEVASKAEEIGRAGEGAIEQSLSGLTEMRDSVEEIAQRVRDLGDQTRRVGGITQSVKDLADQSNMLALNAAIEAVRSGEHGKGFAVVAREIRTLADQSIQQTGRVREILEGTAEAVSTTVAITQKGTERMEAGLAQVRTSGENLKQLASIVGENAAAVRQIAGAVSQQNAGIAQIFTAVTELSKMMDGAVKRLEATNRSAAALKSASEQVTSIVQSYKV